MAMSMRTAEKTTTATPPGQARRAGRTTRTDSAGRLLRVLLREGPSPRSTLARLSGLSPASVTGHSWDLIERGLVAELPGTASSTGMGRPHVPLDLAPDALVGGLHVALAETTVAVLDLRGRVVAERRIRHDGAPAETVLIQAADALHALAAVHGGGSGLLGVGLATGGWVDHDAGTVARHPLLDWQDVPATAIIAGRLAARGRQAEQNRGTGRVGKAGSTEQAGRAEQAGRVEHAGRTEHADRPDHGDNAAAAPGPTRHRPAPIPVHADSHTRALIRAEQLFGRLDPRHSVLALFAGNVVDAAFALGDRVNRGLRSGAGDVAHWPVPGSRHVCECGRSGCLQVALSELRLVQEGVAAGLIGSPAEGSDAVETLLRAAEGGDGAARALFVARSELAGRALAPLADFLNPDVVLVVDRGAARFGEALTALRGSLAEHSFLARTRQPSVIVSSFMDSPLATAAGTVALDVLYRNPLAVKPRRAAP